MTIDEVITYVDEVKPNDYSYDLKIKWLSQLDGIIKRDWIDTHKLDLPFPFPPPAPKEGEQGEDDETEGKTERAMPPYDTDTPHDTVLLAYPPYDMMYVHWVESKIDYHNHEYDKYNNSATQYNDIYTAFARHFSRTHDTRNTKLRYF